MPSIFMQGMGNDRKEPVVSFLFYEIMALIYERVPEISTRELIATTLVQTKQVTTAQVTTDHFFVDAAFEKIDALKKQSEGEAVEAKRKSNKRTFGAKFTRYFEKLDPEKKCLMAADYDFERARYLYCDIDRVVASEIIKAKFDNLFELQMLQFEGVVFGMGGSFKGSANPDDEVTDTRTMTSTQIDASAAAFMNTLGR
jgi:hypothetical protein